MRLDNALKIFSKRSLTPLCPLLSFIVEAIAYAGNGEDKAGAIGSWLDLLAQLSDIDMQAMSTSLSIFSP